LNANSEIVILGSVRMFVAIATRSRISCKASSLQNEPNLLGIDPWADEI
jgi:hypothetical protein